MSPPAGRAAWWPVAVATLLIIQAGGWLAGALPSGPPQPLPEPPATELLTTTTMRNGKVVSVDTVAALAATKAELPQEPQEISADTTIHFASYDPLEGDSLAHPHTYRRYVGTLNGQAIVVHLSVRANVQVYSWKDELAGSWYYRYARKPNEHRLLFQRQRSGQLVLTEALPDNITATDTARIEWQFSWPLGRKLQARRRAVYGNRQQVVSLREDYSQAVRYEWLRLTAHHQYRCEEVGNVHPYHSTEFLHLLSADSLRLVRWQAPPAAARRDSLRRWLLTESCKEVSQSCHVMLNDYGLLSYTIWETGYYYGAHPEHGTEGFIVDLSTGEELLVDELLRPGTEPALLKLLARHLRHDYPEMNEGGNWHWKKVPPLPESFTLTPSGLQADYGEYALAAYASHYASTTTIPYRELRPLVRPGTPLARMLAARGMW